jgi:hypothetical protein
MRPDSPRSEPDAATGWETASFKLPLPYVQESRVSRGRMTVPAGHVMFLFNNSPVATRETAAPARAAAASGEVVDAIRES